MKFFPRAFIFATVVGLAISAFGQEPQDQDGSPANRPADRMNILRDLGLSQDQLRQMRLINRDVRAKRQAARLRVGEATRELDQAIYADSIDEKVVAQRLRDLQQAQADVVRANFENEIAIRKVLNPEQLVRFREMRERFNKAREGFQRQRQDRIENRNMQKPGAGQRRGLPDGNPRSNDR